jgi:hypothetical protein
LVVRVKQNPDSQFDILETVDIKKREAIKYETSIF